MFNGATERHIIAPSPDYDVDYTILMKKKDLVWRIPKSVHNRNTLEVERAIYGYLDRSDIDLLEVTDDADQFLIRLSLKTPVISGRTRCSNGTCTYLKWDMEHVFRKGDFEIVVNFATEIPRNDNPYIRY